MPASHLEMDEKELLIRIDERVEMLGRTLTALVTSLDQRGADIEELKTAKLLHEQETKQQEVKFNELKEKVNKLEQDTQTEFVKTRGDIITLRDASILLIAQRHPKIAMTVVIIFLIMLNFHDIIVPWLFSLFGFKVP